MTIDEDKIREVAEDRAGELLKEACVRTYCEVLDAIRLLEGKPEATLPAAIANVLRRDGYDLMAERHLPKLWARYKDLERSIVEKEKEETERRQAERAKLPWWKRWM